jgi:hypothetical protein
MIRETEENRRAEMAVRDIIIGSCSKCITMKKTRQFHVFDFISYSPTHNRIMLVEIKCRNMGWNKYPDVILKRAKVDAIKPQLEDGCGFRFLITTFDRIGFFDILDVEQLKKYKTTITGARGAEDECYHIPTSEFWSRELTKQEHDKIYRKPSIYPV